MTPANGHDDEPRPGAERDAPGTDPHGEDEPEPGPREEATGVTAQDAGLPGAPGTSLTPGGMDQRGRVGADDEDSDEDGGGARGASADDDPR